MSTSAFHGQFKALTSLTPLQYQKQLRLLEARRLMISSVVNVETAPFQVGYESQWQFSREITASSARRRNVMRSICRPRSGKIALPPAWN